MATPPVPSWIVVSRLLANKDLIEAQRHIKDIAKEFPTQIKFITYENGEQQHTYIADTFAKQFMSLVTGLPGTAPVILAMQYGIPVGEIKAACKRLYISRPSVVAYNPTKKRYSVLKPSEFLKLSGLRPREPFEDPEWITLAQMVKQIYTPRMDSNETREVHVMPLTLMLREFAKKHPQAVYDNMARTHYDALDKFDPMRIRREYLERFKRAFKLDEMSHTQLKQETRVKDDEKLDVLLKAFSNKNLDAVVFSKSTQEYTLRRSFLPKFREYTSAIRKREIMERMREDTLTPQQIMNSYKFINLVSVPILDKRMRKFALHNPNAVVYQDKRSLSDTGLDYYIGVHKDYIDEFIQFSGLKIYTAPEQGQPVQQKAIDPKLPDYQPDKTLVSMSDERKDAVAWHLAKKKVQSAATADELIFAQWMKKRSRKEKA